MHADPRLAQALEAARYAVLRRIGPALRHDLLVNLQSLLMKTEVVTARLDRGLPPLVDLQHHLGRIERDAREAIANSLRAAAWLAPPEDDRIDLRAGIEQCLKLVRGELEFRGSTVQAHLPPACFEVSSACLRPLVIAALIHLADQASARGQLRVDAQLDRDCACLTFEWLADPSDSDSDSHSACVTQDAPLNDRRLAPYEVQVLAAAGGADLYLEHHFIAIGLQRLIPNTALQIAPL